MSLEEWGTQFASWRESEDKIQSLAPQTRAMLHAISEASNNDDFTPAECWIYAGDAIYEWRQAGKPDL
jgi:hypothetical protein